MTTPLEAMLMAADPGGSGSTIGCYKFLHHLASVATRRHGRILEIGTHAGLSSAVMAHAAPHSIVDTVDIATGAEPLQDSQWREFGVYGRVMRHVGDSREVVPTLEGDFDLAFVDGGHADDVVRCDYENVRDRSPVIAFHDAYENAKVLVEALRERAWACVESRPGTLAPKRDWRGSAAAFVAAYPGGEAPVWTRGKITNRAEPWIVVLIASSDVP